MRKRHGSFQLQEIKGRLRLLAGRICSGDDTVLGFFILPGKLAIAHRPLRYHQEFKGSRRDLPPEAESAVRAWVERMKTELGIRSIICLMHPKELAHYDALSLGDKGLVGLYQDNGLEVEHIPSPDPAHGDEKERARRRQQVEQNKLKALEAFRRLPKPVLVHCSAGQDRTSPVAAFILDQEGADCPSIMTDKDSE